MGDGATVRLHGDPVSAGRVFRVFLVLGLTSFGGPTAHLGYFRTEFVERRRWISEQEYAELVALSQFLPGPTSSQVGFGIGLLRSGMAGALAAFLGFTLPSAIAMVAFAYGASFVAGPAAEGVLTGLQVVATAIVAQAVWAMSRTLAPDIRRAGIAVLALIVSTAFAGSFGQLGALVLGALGGVLLCRSPQERTADVLRFPVSRVVGGVSLALFVAVLAVPPIVVAVSGSETAELFAVFAHSGAMVFGGGHVVLPLLQSGVVDSGWVGDAPFLAGYGAVQAVPGPLFTFAAYLGAISDVGPGGVAGAAVALVAIFLPGMLLLVGVLPFWNSVRRRTGAQAAMRGAGAAVVGILAAALYAPVFTSAVTDSATFCLAAACFVLLVVAKAPPVFVVLIGASCGAALSLFG